jgi:hypothetical protein
MHDGAQSYFPPVVRAPEPSFQGTVVGQEVQLVYLENFLLLIFSNLGMGENKSHSFIKHRSASSRYDSTEQRMPARRL